MNLNFDHSKKSWLLYLALAFVPGLFFTQCGGCGGDAMEEPTDTVVIEEPTPVEETTVVMIVHPVEEAPVVKERHRIRTKHKAKAKAVEEKPEEFVQVVKEDIVKAPAQEDPEDVIVFTPHRTTYIPWHPVENEPHEAVREMAPERLLTEFDTPPMYGQECVAKKHAAHCSHNHMQSYLNKNIDRKVFPSDGEDHVEYVSFVVKADGTVEDSGIMVVDQEPKCDTCAAEAKRLVASMDNWIPGTWEGAKVPVRVTLPVRFHEW